MDIFDFSHMLSLAYMFFSYLTQSSWCLIVTFALYFQSFLKSSWTPPYNITFIYLLHLLNKILHSSVFTNSLWPHTTTFMSSCSFEKGLHFSFPKPMKNITWPSRHEITSQILFPSVFPHLSSENYQKWFLLLNSCSTYKLCSLFWNSQKLSYTGCLFMWPTFAQWSISTLGANMKPIFFLYHPPYLE